MYSYKFDEYVAGKARLEDADASYKDLVAVCSNIRGKKTGDALALLEKASKGEVPILYRKFAKRLAHRKELGGRQGRYPEKSAKLVLSTLKNAIASAKANGLSEDLVVAHAAANKKDSYPRRASKGKRMRAYYETSRIEIVVKETKPATKISDLRKKAAEKKEEPKKAAEARPELPKPAEEKPLQGISKAKSGPAPKPETKPASKSETKPKTKKEATAPKGEN